MAELRSSTAGIVQQTPSTEKLNDRISRAMPRWEAVCADTKAALSNIGNWLLTSDNFRICIDNVLAEMEDVRDSIVDINLDCDVLHQTQAEKQTRLDQLSVCVIYVSSLISYRLCNLAHDQPM